MPRLMDTYIENRERIQPGQANSHGTAHGGTVMRVMDEVGAMSAMKFAGHTCVTAHVGGLDFEAPIPVGDTAFVESYVYDAGETSVRVRLRVSRERPHSGEQTPSSDSTFVFVAVDEDNHPVTVPDLTVETERGEQLRREARTAADDHSD
ncbi:MAG: acyl-CoA thioesterase [Halobacteriaceae archaeon]